MRLVLPFRLAPDTLAAPVPGPQHFLNLGDLLAQNLGHLPLHLAGQDHGPRLQLVLPPQPPG